MHQTTPATTAKLQGGRRKKMNKKKVTRRGGYYGFNGALATGAPSWSKSEEVPPLAGGRRHRKKNGKKTRKVKRGGGYFGQVVSGFTGVGTARGLGGYQDVSNPMGKAAGGEFNDHGAKPGDFSSFK